MRRATLRVVGASLPLWVPIAVAVIATFGVLVAATLTAYATERRERRARLAEAESQRLAELAEAALDLRDAVVSESDDATVHRAKALFVARAEAVRAARVRELADEWRRLVDDRRVPKEWPQLLALLREIGRARRDVL